MRKILMLSVIAVLLVFSQNRLSAQASIDLIIFPELNTVDFAAFDFTSARNVSQRLIQVNINPPGVEVIVEGKVDWKKDDRSGFQELFRFRTKKFIARSFSNDEINNSEIEIDNTSFNSSLTSEIIRLGKPSGVITIELRLLDSRGNSLDNDNEEISFLNPTAPSIILPVEGSSYDIGSIIVQWTASIGVTSYKIKANYAPDNAANPEQALNSGKPLIDDRDVGTVTSIRLNDILNRELLADTNIVIVVKAFVQGPGGGDVLSSPLVTFKTNSTGTETTVVKIGNPDLVRLANLLPGQISKEFRDKLINGDIMPEQIQFSDENGNSLTFSDFVSILNFLEQNNDAIITVIFSPK
ncbi:MAG TPA: hypothetical protein PLZ15_14220 [Melioribacteraceae bacterium]|nr:hypothetical protein [Melioribacteraceae bacterium]